MAVADTCLAGVPLDVFPASVLALVAADACVGGVVVLVVPLLDVAREELGAAVLVVAAVVACPDVVVWVLVNVCSLDALAETFPLDVVTVELTVAGGVVTVAGTVTVGVGGTRPSARAMGGSSAQSAGAVKPSAANPATSRRRRGACGAPSEQESSREATVSPPDPRDLVVEIRGIAGRTAGRRLPSLQSFGPSKKYAR